MTDIKEGSIVKCAFCRKETAVQIISEYNGISAYTLGCFHRNTICPSCGQLAKDISETISAVEKHCAACDPPLDDDE